MTGRATITIRAWAAWASAAIALLVLPRPAASQTWEYSPYNIRLWVAVDPTPQTLGLSEEVQRDVAQGMRLAAGAAWRIFPEDAPPAVHSDIVARLQDMTAEQVRTAVPEAFSIEARRYGRYYVPADGDQD